jgi:hypothetical protein
MENETFVPETGEFIEEVVAPEKKEEVLEEELSEEVSEEEEL